MVPLFSYLVLKGRCRFCKAFIPLRLFIIELLTGLVFLAIFLQHGLGPDFVVLAAAASLFIAVGIIDLEHGIIPNRIVFSAAVLALALAPFWNELGFERSFLSHSDMLASLYNSLTAGAGAFLVFFGIFLVYPRGMGGSDVEFVGVIGLLLGVSGTLVGLCSAVLLGGAAAIGLIVTRKKGRKDAIPYCPFLSVGAIVGLLWGQGIITAYQSLIDRLAG
jgi:leader peptidase (prepilin peptidase)/N-methyltransferase